MNKIVITILYSFIALTCCIISCFSEESDKSLPIVGYCSITVLFSYLFFDYWVNNRFTYSALFVLILYLFHFGQLVLLTFFMDSYDHIRFLELIDIGKALYSFRIMTISISALCIGILFKSASYNRKQTKINKYYIDIKSVALKIIYATFFVKLALDIATLYICLTEGGIAARSFVNSFPNILLFYGKISLLGFALLLIALKYHPQKQKKLFVFIMCYILFMMLSGIRSENVGYLAIFLFIYLQSRLVPLKTKQLLLCALGGFGGLTFIVAVGQFRNYTDKSVDSFIELSNNLLTKENVILDLFDTCGDTGYTAHETLNEYLPKYGPSYGDAYYKGITAIIPNLFPFILDIGHITEQSSTPIKLQRTGVLNSNYYNIGGSFLAEQYLNFGVIGGIIICFIWGLFFGWVGKSTAIAFESHNVYQLIITIPLMLASIYWVRSYFGGGIREAVWDIIFGLFIIKKSRK